MPDQKNDKPAYDFPTGLAQPALRPLIGAGFTCLDQLTKVMEADLLKLHGMGPKALALIRGALSVKGLSFTNPE